VRPKYALHPLRKLREDRVTEQGRAVAKAEAALAAARSSVAQAREARHAEQAVSERECGAERQLLDAGQVRAVDLQQGERYKLGAAERLAQLLRQEVGAERQASGAAAVEHEARVDLAQARADAEALERHHARFVAEQRRAAELTEEEAQLDRWTADRYGKQRG
jgi:hypothetical protein